MKRRFTVAFAFTVMALIGLVPIAATPAAAAGTLDVVITSPGLTDPEVAVGITNHYFELTATNDPPIDDETVNFDRTGDFMSDASCTTDATGVCSVFLTSATETTDPEEIRAWVNDGPPTALCNPVLPGSDCDGTEGVDETTPEGEGNDPEPDDTDVVSLQWLDGFLDVEPETTPVGPSTAVTLTATVLEEDPATPGSPRGLIANVDAEITDGPQKDLVPGGIDAECDTAQANGECSLTYTPGATAGVDLWLAWVDENEGYPGATPADPADPPGGDETSGDGFEADSTEGRDEVGTPGAEPETPEGDITDVVEVAISAEPQLQVVPTTQTKTTGGTAIFTATATEGGTPQNAQPIAMTVYTGPNMGKTATCNTGALGTCDLSYAGGATAGSDRARFWVDTNGNGQIDEGDATEDVGVDGGTPEPDTTAVATVTWAAPTQPGGDGDGNCNLAKKKLKKAKKALKKAKKALAKAKQGGDDDRIEKKKKKVNKLKKKVNKLKKRKRRACA